MSSKRGVTRETSAALSAWGNWYIMRTSHEFGWGSQWAVLNYHGLLASGHKILFDAPAHVRLIDMAVGQLHYSMRACVVLHYCWHRDGHGDVITDADRAAAMNASLPSYRALLKSSVRRVERYLNARG